MGELVLSMKKVIAILILVLASFISQAQTPKLFLHNVENKIQIGKLAGNRIT